MIYALVRGWLAGMAAVFIEILLATAFFIPDISPRSLSEGSALPLTPLLILVFIEEGIKFLALRGISSESVPFFRNSFFKGLLVGFGFAAFEICLKVLFYDQSTASALSMGALCSGLLHIATGGILGAALLFRRNGRMTFFFPALLFLLAILIHSLYNIVVSSILFEKFS